MFTGSGIPHHQKHLLYGHNPECMDLLECGMDTRLGGKFKDLRQWSDCFSPSLHCSRQAPVYVGTAGWLQFRLCSYSHTIIRRFWPPTRGMAEIGSFRNHPQISPTLLINLYSIFMAFLLERRVNVQRASCRLPWSLALVQRKQGSRNRLVWDSTPLWSGDTSWGDAVMHSDFSLQME